jgi:hypothetical protein
MSGKGLDKMLFVIRNACFKGVPKLSFSDWDILISPSRENIRPVTHGTSRSSSVTAKSRE